MLRVTRKSMEEQQTIQTSEAQPIEAKTEKPKRKMSKAKAIIILAAVVVVWFLAVQFLAAERYGMQVNVKAEENVMGVNPTDESLDFGDLSRNLGATRIVTLKNSSKSDKYILVWLRGEVAGMIKLNKNNFVLKPGEEVKLEFALQVPPSAEPRIYKGTAMIFRWPKIF